MWAGAWAHIIVGTLVLILALWRLSLRFARGVPPGPAEDNQILELAGVAGHWALYILMIVLHVLAAPWHHFIRKDGLLNRMRTPG